MQEFELSKYISMLYRHGRSDLDLKMSNYAIGSGQYAFLFYLYKHDGPTQDELSRALDMDKTTTTRAIQKLEKKGLIIRKKDTSDHRINHIYLTETGISIKKNMKQFAKEWQDILLQDFNSDEIILLEKMIKKLSKNARENRQTTLKKGGHNVE